MPSWRRRPTTLLLAGAIMAATVAPPLASPLRAQVACTSGDPGCSLTSVEARGGTSLEVLGANTALGAVSAAIIARLTGRPVMRAAALGALGGVITFGGKRIAVQNFDGAGLISRQVGAVGASITRDAIEGAPPFRRLILPLGIARLHLDADAPDPVRLRADLAAIIASGIAIQGGGSFDLGYTLSNGTPTFRLDRLSSRFNGVHVAGVIWLHETADASIERHTLAHERVHVIQHDATFIGWTEPVERATLPTIRGLRWLHHWADFGLHVPLRASANAILNYDNRPWEWEAGVLSGSRDG